MTEPFKFPRFDGDALCASTDDPEAFFPEKGGSSGAAKKLCAGCEVREPCLAWAVANNEAGVWGGLSEFQRRDLRKARPRRTGRLMQPIRHGTDAGASQHRYRGEQPCDRCAKAANAAWSMRQNKDECPVCGDLMLRSSIRRHVERRHPDAQDAA